MGERHDHCDHDPIECTYDALVAEHREAVAERDRLRAVVDAARDVVATWRALEGTGPEGSSNGAYAEWLTASEVLEAAVDQLDGSTVIGEAEEADRG